MSSLLDGVVDTVKTGEIAGGQLMEMNFSLRLRRAPCGQFFLEVVPRMMESSK